MEWLNLINLNELKIRYLKNRAQYEKRTLTVYELREIDFYNEQNSRYWIYFRVNI